MFSWMETQLKPRVSQSNEAELIFCLSLESKIEIHLCCKSKCLFNPFLIMNVYFSFHHHFFRIHMLRFICMMFCFVQNHLQDFSQRSLSLLSVLSSLCYEVWITFLKNPNSGILKVPDKFILIFKYVRVIPKMNS